MVESRASTRRGARGVSVRGIAVRSAWLVLAVVLCLALPAPPAAHAAVAQGGHRARAEAAPRSEIDVLARSVGETLARASRSRVTGGVEAPTTVAHGARPRRRKLLVYEEGEQPPPDASPPRFYSPGPPRQPPPYASPPRSYSPGPPRQPPPYASPPRFYSPGPPRQPPPYASPPRFYSPGPPDYEHYFWQDHGDEAGGYGGSTSCQADAAGTLWSVGGAPIADIGSVYDFRAGRFEHTVSVHGQLEVNGKVRVRRMGVRGCLCACTLPLVSLARAREKACVRI